MQDQINAECGNCVAWTPRPVTGVVAIGAPAIGVCRMFPPTPAPVYDNSGRVVQQINLRPTTASNDACLHFVIRPDLMPPEIGNA